jgi:uncharacterized protein (TIGR03435 family)
MRIFNTAGRKGELRNLGERFRIGGMNVRLMLVIALSATGTLAAQKFEAASVRVADRCSMENTVDAATIGLHGDPLNVVLMTAFNVKADQIVGPSWLDSDCFTINAKMPQGATKDQLPTLLQALLAERFGLVAHKENHPKQGFGLVVDKNGPKVKASDLNSPDTIRRAGQVQFGAGSTSAGIKGSMTMATLVRLLSNRVKVPVEDLTGLEGKYDVDISWAPDPAFERPGGYALATAESHPNVELPPAPEADLFMAARESLGLRLEARKEQVEVVVIDHIERVPTGN